MVYCAERQNISLKVITDFQTKAAGTCFRKNAKRLDLKTTERKENNSAKQSNTLVIKQSQGPLVLP